MWHYALWGLLGAAANVGVVFLEATRRVKGWPWAHPHGPGGGVYVASVVVNLGVSSCATAAVSTSGIVTSGMIAFGMGVAGPTVVKKVAGYVQALLPETDGYASDDARGLDGD